MTTPVFDGVIVGGGIVGLAAARALLARHPGLGLAVLEREPTVASQQTGHNSGVIHSGVYYAPGSLKARLCVAGRRALVRYCEERAIPHRICGKLIVALRADELGRLDDIYRRGQANGVEELEMLEPEGLRAVEPAVRGIRALRVGCTGVVDFARVAHAYADDVGASGGVIRTGWAVHGMGRRGGDLVLESARGSIRTRHAITCGGLFADRLAALSGASRDMRVVPFRGDFYVLSPAAADCCRALIYPVPDPSFPFLGVHFTRRIDGAVWAGPNAVLAFARQGYGRWDLDLRDLWEALTWPGFWRLAARHWRQGLAEWWRDYSKSAYLRTLQAYVPSLGMDDLRPGPSGVRAQMLARDGGLVDDFAVHEDERVIHVLNAPSPAATSSLAIGEMIADRADARFGW